MDWSRTDWNRKDLRRTNWFVVGRIMEKRRFKKVRLE